MQTRELYAKHDIRKCTWCGYDAHELLKKSKMSVLEKILSHFGMPKENIVFATTQIAQTYGAERYLEGVAIGAEAHAELGKQAEEEFGRIPVTTELLEKNGFICKHPDSQKHIYWKDPHSQIVVHKKKGHLYFEICGNAKEYGLYCPCFHGHIFTLSELQVALMLCRIDKKIEL